MSDIIFSESNKRNSIFEEFYEDPSNDQFPLPPLQLPMALIIAHSLITRYGRQNGIPAPVARQQILGRNQLKGSLTDWTSSLGQLDLRIMNREL